MKLIFATHNQNKFNEVKLLMPQHIELLSLNDIGLTEEIPETGKTLEENALCKADFVTLHYDLPCFSDDTGLLIDALNGAPGVYSARYAGGDKNADKNMDKVLKAMKDKESRAAHFKTVIALNLNGESILFKGIVHGEITKKRQGSAGFGYDPIFKPMGYLQTFAELSLSEKNEIGHRGKAIEQLIDHLQKNQGPFF